MYVRPIGLTDLAPEWLRTWRGDGIIARVETARMAQLLLRTRLPVVNLRRLLPGVPFPYVGVDNAEVSKLAANHLLERGIRHFGFVGRMRGENLSLDLRADHFRQLVGEAGHRCELFPTEPTAGHLAWEDEQERLSHWISSLPKPVGIMAANDERGLHVLDAARRAGLHVPDDVAVVGVDNDEALCNLGIPALSSVDVNPEGIGYEAAAMLDKMMAGRDFTSHRATVLPRGVITRQSTDVVASEDEDVSRAIQYIRDTACKGLMASDVLAFVGVSRTSLQQRMKQVTGRTIHQEIQRVRLNRAKELLAGSSLAIKQVAIESGFSSVQYLTRVFRATTGETPAGYRSKRAG